MFNVHQVCRLCMIDINLGGIDCLMLRDLRVAIKTLYDVEIKATDNYSKRICKPCFDKVANFLLHHTTVKETQQKIKHYTRLHNDVRTSLGAANVKVERDDMGPRHDVSICVNESDEDERNTRNAVAITTTTPHTITTATASTTSPKSALSKSIATISPQPTVRIRPQPASERKRKTHENVDKRPNTMSIAATTSDSIIPTTSSFPKTTTSPVYALAKTTIAVLPESTIRIRTQSLSGNKRKPQEIQLNTGLSNQKSLLPAETENTSPISSKDYHEKTLKLVNNHNAALDTPNPIRLSEPNEQSEPQKEDLQNVNLEAMKGNKSPIFELYKDQNIPQLKVNTVLEKKVYIKDINTKIDVKKFSYGKYLSSPSCTSCKAKLITWAEARFHTQSHRSKKCCVCDEEIDEHSIRTHVYQCLLPSGTLTQKELLSYMKRCTVDIIEDKNTAIQIRNLAKKVTKKRVRRSNSKKKQDGTAGTSKKSAARGTPRIPSGDAVRRNNNVYGIKVNRKNQSVSADSSSDSANVRPLNVSENLSMPIWWDHEATKEKLFSINDLPKTSETYIDLDESTSSSLRVNIDTPPELSGTCTPMNNSLHKPSIASQISNLCDKINTFKNKFLNEVSNTTSDLTISSSTKDSLPSKLLETNPGQDTDSSDKNSPDKNSTDTIDKQKGTTRKRPRIKFTEKRSRERTVSERIDNIYSAKEAPIPEKRRYSVPHNTLDYDPSDRLVKNFPINTFYTNDFPNKNVNDTNHKTDAYSRAPEFHTLSDYDKFNSALDLSATNSSSFLQILSPNELNLRHIEQYNTNNSDSKHKSTTSRNDTMCSPFRYDNTLSISERLLGQPIHVSLIKRNTGELELTLTQDKFKIEYEQLNYIQRSEVQRSLLTQDIWFRMLEHIKNGTPTKETLTLFEKLLPSHESKIFFNSYNAVKKNCQKFYK